MKSRLLALLACTSVATFAAIPAAHAEEVLTAETGAEVGIDPVDVGTPDVKIDDGAYIPVDDVVGGIDEAPGVDVPVDVVDEKVELLDPSDPSIYESRIPLPEERIYTMTGGDIGEASADNAAENAADLAADRVVERVQASAATLTSADPQ